MDVDTGQFAALTEQVAGLEAEVRRLWDQAYTLKTLDELRLERAGYPARPATPARRPRHLRAVDGGQP